MWEDFSTTTGLYNVLDKPFVAATLWYMFTDETWNINKFFNLSEEDNDKPEVIIVLMEELSKGLINEKLERHF